MGGGDVSRYVKFAAFFLPPKQNSYYIKSLQIIDKFCSSPLVIS